MATSKGYGWAPIELGDQIGQAIDILPRHHQITLASRQQIPAHLSSVIV
jgi:hypothetical protein